MAYTTSPSRRLMALGVVAAAMLAAVGVARASATKSGSVDAIWHVQSIPFKFHGLDVLYNCDSFQKKLKTIMVAVGAHPSVIVDVSCQPNTMTNRITSRITLANPMVASEENIQAATTFDSRRKLLARMQKTQLPTQQSIQTFPAVWTSFAVEENVERPLEPSDCELMEALNEQVFPKLGIEIVQSRLRCNSAMTRLMPAVRVMALMPALTEPVAAQTRRKHDSM